MADQQILVSGTSAVPLTYTVPNAIEAALLCVNATIDGTAASGQFLATVEIISDGGVVVARCPCFTTIAAGGSAEISWFRLRETTVQSTGQSTYENLILTTGGIVLYWKLDETSGTTIIDSKGSNNATYFNGPTLGVSPLADGHAVTFDGVNTYGGTVNSPPYTDLAGSIHSVAGMSVECWFQTTMAPGAGTNPSLIDSDTVSPDGRWFRVLQVGGTQKIAWNMFATDSTGFLIQSTGAVNDGAKHHLVVTFDGTTQKLYLDGTLNNSVVPAMGGFGLEQRDHGLWIGRGSPAGAGSFNAPAWAGTLDEVAIYNVAISAAQVAAHNTAGRIV